jgi:hypothetical protein
MTCLADRIDDYLLGVSIDMEFSVDLETVVSMSNTFSDLWVFNCVSPLLPPGYRLINSVSLWVVEVYQICTAYFSQVMHFIVTWLCAVRRGKGTGHPIPFNSWLSTPRGGGMGCACVCMCRYMLVHGCVGMRIWCQHCMRIQPAFGLITVHVYIHIQLRKYLIKFSL